MSAVESALEELEAKITTLDPSVLRPSAPATNDDLRLAERLHGAELTDELVVLARRHNGCLGWPNGQFHRPLVSDPNGLELFGAMPLSGGPFKPRSTVVFAALSGYSYLVTPLAGDYRGHVFRLDSEGYFGGYVAPSISDVFTTWIDYLDNEVLVVNQSGDLVVRTSVKHVVDGSETITAALSLLPSADPLTLDHLIYVDDPVQRQLIASRSSDYGMDPRRSPWHPEHEEWYDAARDVNREELVAVRTELTGRRGPDSAPRSPTAQQ